MTVTTHQRFTREHPCPVCGGHDALPRGHQERCYGFLSDDGGWAFCTRAERAGGLPQNSGSDTYAHRLDGDCGCGVRHDPKPAPVRSEAPRRSIEVAAYDYRDEAGKLLFQVVRKEPKNFVQRRPEGAGWTYSVAGVRKVPYRLPELIAADPERPTFICAGEKDVIRLVELGQVATTNPMGEKKGKWLDDYSEFFKERRVVILEDNDDDGREHVQRVAQSLLRKAASVKIKVLALPGLPEKGDISDWLDAGHTIDELLELVDKTPRWKATDGDPPRKHQAKEHLESTVAASTNGAAPTPKPQRDPIPEFPEAAFHGIFSLYLDAMATTEAPPAHHFAAFLSVTSAMLGRLVNTAYDRPTYPNRNIILTGATGSVRKTSTMRKATDLAFSVDPTLERLTGVGSAEALAEAVATADMNPKQRERYQDIVEGKSPDGEIPLAGPQGRRLLLVLEEWAALLLKARSEAAGSLLPIIVQLYDTPDQLDHKLRAKSIVALRPTLSILGASAPEWIQRHLSASELMSGFANRFEFWLGEAGEPIPWPEPPRQEPRNKVMLALHDALAHWREDPLGRTFEFTLDGGARRHWAAYYTTFQSRIRSYDDGWAAVVQRCPTFAVKTALTFAALEAGEQTITEEHIERATMIADYLEACAGELLGGVGVSEDVKLQVKIVARLTDRPATRRAVQQAFGGNVAAPVFKRVWEALAAGKLIQCEANGTWCVPEEEPAT